MYLVIIVFLALFFLGYKLGWSIFQYDELRLLQLFITAICFILVIFKSKFTLDLKTAFLFFLSFLFFLFQLNVFTLYEYQDLILIIVLTIIPFTLSLELKKYEKNQCLNHALFFLIICAVLPVLFITLSIRDLLSQGIWYSWQMNAGNIRIFDSVIVPIIFFAVYLKVKNYKYISNIYPFIIFLLTLGLWFDGARAALLGIIIGLATIFIFSRDYRKTVVATTFVIFLSFIVYNSTYYFYNLIHEVDKSLNVIRTSSSGRWELWSYVYQKWIEQPWKGVGGNFLATTDYPLNHLHNFYLKLIFEWGILGFIYLSWIFYQIKKVLTSNDVHISLKAGICAIAIDAFFSGNLIYPASQISIILLLGVAFSQYKANVQINEKMRILSKLVIILWFGLYIYILGNYFIQDLLCWQCGSYSDLMAPGFWYYGKAEHLIHHSLIP